MNNNYYEKLKFFFEYRWLAEDNSFLLQLKDMSESELKVLHDIVFAETQEDKISNINVFYDSLEKKYNDAKSYMQKMNNKMKFISNELDEIFEKESNESDFSDKVTNF